MIQRYINQLYHGPLPPGRGVDFDQLPELQIHRQRELRCNGRPAVARPAQGGLGSLRFRFPGLG